MTNPVRLLTLVGSANLVRLGVPASPGNALACPTRNIDDLEGARMMLRIDPDTCIGCTKCAKVCPTECISGERKEAHEIDQEKCVRCYKCYDVCPVDAVAKLPDEAEEVA